MLAEFLRGQLLGDGRARRVLLDRTVHRADSSVRLPIGILTGLLVFIPYVGFGLGLMLGVCRGAAAMDRLAGVHRRARRCTASGSCSKAMCSCPYLVGDRIGLHPLAVIFALLAFGQLFGFAGVLLALPASAALLVGLRAPARRVRRVPDLPARTDGVAEQLVLALAEPEPPTFANFVVGPNAEAVPRSCARPPATIGDGVLLWGAQGVRQDALCLPRRRGGRAGGGRDAAIARAADGRAATRRRCGVRGRRRRSCGRRRAEARLFTLFNAVRAAGRPVSPRPRLPPRASRCATTARTRLGWGLTLEILPLADADKPAALVAYARQRGFASGDDVIAYLLAHGRRDMRSLVATLAALDRHSLATRRPITVPLLREWMQRRLMPVRPARVRRG